MSASQNNLTLNINQQDSDGTNIVNRTVGAIGYAGVAGEMHTGLLDDTSETTMELPTSPVLQFYIKNTHATGTITVKWTPQGGAEATIFVLHPGGAIAFWEAVTSGSGGFTSLKLTASVANTTYEMFIGG